MPPTPSVIQIGTVESFLGVLVIVITVGAAWGSLKTTVEHLSKAIDGMKVDIKDLREQFSGLREQFGGLREQFSGLREQFASLRERVAAIENVLDVHWRDRVAPGHSPRQLNERGHQILEESGVQTIIEEKRGTIVEMVRARTPKTAFDAEEAILAVVGDLPKHFPEIIDRLKDGAFKAGTDIPTILLTGGFDLRDKIFPELGFTIDGVRKS